MVRQLVCLIRMSLFVFAIEGCSNAESCAVVVSGRVTYKNKPVSGVGVRFYESRVGYSLVANLDADGRYETPSALPVGSYQVSITGAQPVGRQVPDAPPASPIPPAYVHESYRDGAKSGLLAIVSTLDSEFDFDITAAPKKSKIPAGKVMERMKPQQPSK